MKVRNGLRPGFASAVILSFTPLESRDKNFGLSRTGVEEPGGSTRVASCAAARPTRTSHLPKRKTQTALGERTLNFYRKCVQLLILLPVILIRTSYLSDDRT